MNQKIMIEMENIGKALVYEMAEEFNTRIKGLMPDTLANEETALVCLCGIVLQCAAEKYGINPGVFVYNLGMAHGALNPSLLTESLPKPIQEVIDEPRVIVNGENHDWKKCDCKYCTKVRNRLAQMKTV